MTSGASKRTPFTQQPVIFIVDDDDAMRRGLEFLMNSLGYRVQSFTSASDFLGYYRSHMRGCVIADVRMPRMSGEELHRQLRLRGHRIPLILITAYATVPMAVRSLHAGVFDFIEKPFDDQELIDRVQRALQCDAEARLDYEREEEARVRYEQMTPREQEVMALVVAGLMNREIADMLTIGIKTVEDHRARVMQKMGAHGLADLVRMGTLPGLD